MAALDDSQHRTEIQIGKKQASFPIFKIERKQQPIEGPFNSDADDDSEMLSNTKRLKELRERISQNLINIPVLNNKSAIMEQRNPFYDPKMENLLDELRKENVIKSDKVLRVFKFFK